MPGKVRDPQSHVMNRQRPLLGSSLQRGPISPGCPTMSYLHLVYSNSLENTMCSPLRKHLVKSELDYRTTG